MKEFNIIIVLIITTILISCSGKEEEDPVIVEDTGIEMEFGGKTYKSVMIFHFESSDELNEWNIYEGGTAEMMKPISMKEIAPYL